ncbi:MAG: pseudouridine-5'-phosphate glycosidase [Dongiaceae bacterium]
MSAADLQLAPEVAAALAAGGPVVALESTIISHGMPYPRNLETARRVEAAIRAEGAVPATIAVLDGRLRVGLGAAELERLATARDLAKLSRRDLAAAIATGGSGATTVAATMIGAALAGIAVFATGGIGGVHRGGESSLDISADLEELARTPVAVVCAGAKAILDLPRTLEYLETRGVPVIGFGTDAFPAFYTRDSGLAVDRRADSGAEVAAIMAASRRLGLGGGLLVANPIPEAHALPRATVEAAIAAALADAERDGVRGKAVTPFLLGRLEALTGGASLAANIELVISNARVGAAIAVAEAALRRGR